MRGEAVLKELLGGPFIYLFFFSFLFGVFFLSFWKTEKIVGAVGCFLEKRGDVFFFAITPSRFVRACGKTIC